MLTTFPFLSLLCVLTRPVLSDLPNIVIFLADDLGYGDLGCYGNGSVSTPNIDQLARDGVKMTQHLTAASLCTPSRAAMLTGRYAIRSGMAGGGIMRVSSWVMSKSGLPASEITIAELTKQAGYRNGYIGKWHLGLHADSDGDNMHHPLNQGFDHFYGLIGTNLDDFGGDEGEKVIVKFRPNWYKELFVTWAVIVSTLWCFLKTGVFRLRFFLIVLVLWTFLVLVPYLVMENFTLLCSFLHRNYDLVEQPIRLAGLSQRLVKEGTGFIQNATDAGQPFMLMISWSHMHTFLRTAPEFQGRSKLGLYGDALLELDWSVGEIVKGIQKHGVADNTLVYFTSDNGGHIELATEGGSNGILKGGKSHGAPDGGIRVPGLIKWPGKLPTNTVMGEMTSLMDVFHLVSSVTGANIPDDRQVDGLDILPLLRGETTVSPHEFLFHYCGDRLHGVRYRPRTGTTTWKFVTHVPPLLPGSEGCLFICSCSNAKQLPQPLLYDMTSDPGERSPIDVSSDVYKRVSMLIFQAIEEHKQSINPVPSQFDLHKLMPQLLWQPCCNGVFPFNCKCNDPKYPE